MSEYAQFLERKTQAHTSDGFTVQEMPTAAFGFQRHLVEFAAERGRSAIFADCGMGKTLIELAWAENAAVASDGNVLILAPIAVGSQTVSEGVKFGIPCAISRDGKVAGRITVTNYERLHLFSPTEFQAVVCDESSILKHFSGATQKAVTRFLLKIPFRLLCTATPAPNDHIELGTASEALGVMGYSDVLTRFFVMDDKKRCRMNDVKLARAANAGKHYAKLAYRASQEIGAWRLKGHAEIPFWRWVCSWARACSKPSDLGFNDAGFDLPPLIETQHVVIPNQPAPGCLFTIPAFGLGEEREERRRTLLERCARVAELANHSDPVVVWCHLNAEGDMLARMIHGSLQVKGANTEEQKETAYRRFADGSTRCLIIKPKIGAWGMNWQHCAHVITFASHSWEQYYQSVRRCWRFGQRLPVTVDIISSEGESRLMQNMVRKSKAAVEMFGKLVQYMNDPEHVGRVTWEESEVEIPGWLNSSQINMPSTTAIA